MSAWRCKILLMYISYQKPHDELPNYNNGILILCYSCEYKILDLFIVVSIFNTFLIDTD